MKRGVSPDQLPATDRKALNHFCRELRNHYNDRLKQIIFYGYKGREAQGSDMDVLVVLEDVSDRSGEMQVLQGFSGPVTAEHNVLITAIPVGSAYLESQKESSFFGGILRDGIILEEGSFSKGPAREKGGPGAVEANLKKLGITLPPAPRPVANYVPCLRTGNLLFSSGMLPFRDGKLLFKGKIGAERSLEEGQAAAREAVINALAVIKEELGGFGKIVRVIRLTGHVASAPGFVQQPLVLNGASDLLVELFGEAGRHTRVALGAAELPLNSSVEIELLLEIRD